MAARKPDGSGIGRPSPSHNFKSSGSSLLPWLALAAIVLIADQFTKVLILGYYQLGGSTPVTEFFNVVRVHNSRLAHFSSCKINNLNFP